MHTAVADSLFSLVNCEKKCNSVLIGQRCTFRIDNIISYGITAYMSPTQNNQDTQENINFSQVPSSEAAMD